MQQIVAFAQFVPATVWGLLAVAAGVMWGVLALPRALLSKSEVGPFDTIGGLAGFVGAVALLMLVIR